MAINQTYKQYDCAKHKIRMQWIALPTGPEDYDIKCKMCSDETK